MTDGVKVIVGVSVIVGVMVMEGVIVAVGVWVIVAVGGKKLYATGSAKRLIRNARIPKKVAKNNKRQPRTILSLRIRKKRSVLALRIARIPNHRQKASPKTDRTIAT